MSHSDTPPGNLVVSIATNDGVRVADHFRSSLYFEQFSFSGQQLISRERIDKSLLDGFDLSVPPNQTGEPIDQHLQMSAALSTSNVVITRGIGRRLFSLLTGSGCRVIVTREWLIDTAVSLLLQNRLTHHPDRIH
ncbi:MAG: hypothetical protein HUU10_13520 [Bacteroidetes bacterium]|nr:hypothetical protein [Bacteroidota bacterium]